MAAEEPKVKSLDKALRLLEYFTPETPELGITELAEKMGVTKSNVHNIISTFQNLGYVEKAPNGKYTLGLKMLEFAYIINQHLGYPKAVHDLLMEAAALTDEIVYFGLPYGTQVLYLYVAHPLSRMAEFPYREILGEKGPLYATGIGKAILANLPEAEWPEHIPAVRTAFTPNTFTDYDAFLQELRRTRTRGYAIDNVEHEPNVRCVAVPVFNTAGTLVGGMSTSGPLSIMTDEKLMECASILQNAALKMKERIYR